MKLLTKELKKKLPSLESQEENKDPQVVCKFFTPSSSFTWLVIEGEPDHGEPEDGNWIFFTKCYSQHCPKGELGYVTLEQLTDIKGHMGLGVERDLYFTPKPLSQCNNMS